MRINYKKRNQSGFTLLEILIVIGLIAILAAVVLVAINPGRQFAQARNTQRLSNINTIANAITQNAADNRGIFTCSAGALSQIATEIKSDSSGYNIRDCLVPNYLPEIPIDPTVGTFVSSASYKTGYTLVQDSVTNRITVAAPSAELNQQLSTTR